MTSDQMILNAARELEQAALAVEQAREAMTQAEVVLVEKAKLYDDAGKVLRQKRFDLFAILGYNAATGV